MKTFCHSYRYITPAMNLALLFFALNTYGLTNNLPNRLIDYDTFLTNAVEVGRLRPQRRLSEEQFIKTALLPRTVILDARSDDKFQKMHIKSAKHLSFTEITANELARILPDKSTR